jgi:7,8-dihydroneopterin aldolase/epimerase/oxygenase
MNVPQRLSPRKLAPQKQTGGTQRTIFIRDLNIPARIGVHAFEKEAAQPVCINVDLVTDDEGKPLNDDFDNTVCYETTVNGIKAIISDGHINLVETLAENIAAFCLSDTRVLSVKVRVEKPDILPEAASVGVEIERYQMLRVDLPETS